MNWTSPADLKLEVQKWWDKGDLLREQLQLESSFPRRLKFKTPSSSEMIGSFEELRSWVSTLLKLDRFRVVMREVNHRVYSKNSVPSEVWVDTVDDAMAILGKKKEAKRFSELIAYTKTEQPSLITWLAKKPLQALSMANEWQQILQVVNWVSTNPRPGIYTRQVDIPGLDTKFIEKHREILSECLDLVLQRESIDESATGLQGFAQRYGFKEKTKHIRIRFLDPSCFLSGTTGDEEDIYLDLKSFATLRTTVRQVFITENEINFLSLPNIPGSMAIFGAGYGFDTITEAHWLNNCKIYYWGDVDTHGFAILSDLRSHFPQTESIMMDEKTLLEHFEFKVEEQNQNKAKSLPYLTRAEDALYTKLKENEFAHHFRLEQERIPWNYATKRIESLGSDSSAPASEITLSNDTMIDERIVLSSQDLRDLVQPSKCARRLRLKLAKEQKTDESPLVQTIKQLHKQFLLQQFKNLGYAEENSSRDHSARHESTLRSIEQKQEVIFRPLLICQSTFRGTPVSVHAEADLLLRESDGYLARNFRIGSSSSADGSAAALSLELFRWVFQQDVQVPIIRTEVFSSDGQIFELASLGTRNALRYLNQILEIKSSPSNNYEPVSWTKCGGCDFKTRCWQDAVRNDDVSILAGVDQELATALHDEGFGSVRQLLDNFDHSSLSNFKRYRSGKMTKVGRESKRILATARALSDQQCVIIDEIDLVRPRTYVILDLEGVPGYLDSIEEVFLWGMQIFGEFESNHIAIMNQLNYSDTDETTWRGFLTSTQEIFDEHGDIPIFHWHHYERSKIDLYVQRYGDLHGVATRIKKNFIDLHALVKNNLALPVYSYSLKEVEKYIGFERSMPNQDGGWAIAQILQAKQCSNKQEFQSSLEQLAFYNREDLMATNAVLQWLLKTPVN